MGLMRMLMGPSEYTSEQLLGKTIVDIYTIKHIMVYNKDQTKIIEEREELSREVKNGDDNIVFETSDGTCFKYNHWQDCCESVAIEDISGDLNDLIGSPVTMAEETSGNNPDAGESGTWTFYKFATVNGYVTIRWFGESNGYYSESVDLDVYEKTADRNKN